MIETMLGEVLGIGLLVIFILVLIFIFILIFIGGIKAIKFLIKGD